MFSDTLPTEPGYYWERDEQGRITIAFVFEELVWDAERKKNVSNG